MNATVDTATEKIPTSEFYDTLQRIYHVFNDELFDGELPNCMITVQRKKNTMGYFSADRWVDNEGNKTHEIAINPAYFATCNFIEIFQTMVHEMCHLWQHEQGKPSRNGYHNKEWAQKMESLGLMPTDTGEEGGKRTGQKMSDYPISDGQFENVCKKLAQSDLFIRWVDRFPEKKVKPSPMQVQTQNEEMQEIKEEYGTDGLEGDEVSHETMLEQEGHNHDFALYEVVANVIEDIVDVETIEENVKKKRKTKYMCPKCEIAVWGKPDLNIGCNDCSMPLEAVDH